MSQSPKNDRLVIQVQALHILSEMIDEKALQCAIEEMQHNVSRDANDYDSRVTLMALQAFLRFKKCLPFATEGLFSYPESFK